MGEEETRMAFRGGVAVGLAALRAGRRLQSDRCVGCGLGVRPSLPAPATPRAAARAAFSGRAQGRPFRVLGLQQVAVGAESKDDMRRIWQDMRGLATVEVDIMAPLDVTKSPKVHVPNLNHIGLWGDKLEESVVWLKSSGVRFAGGIRVGAAGHKVAFIHPKGNADSPIGGAGVLIELVQAPDEVIKAFAASDSQS